MAKKKKSRKEKKTAFTISGIFSERFVSVVSLIISGLTLYLGYVAYQKLLVDRVKTDQLNLVIELVEAIQEDEILISTYPKIIGPMGMGHSERRVNVFSLSIWDESDLNFDIYKPGNFIWQPKTDEYLYNPLVPEKIARSLLKFRTDFNSQRIW